MTLGLEGRCSIQLSYGRLLLPDGQGHQSEEFLVGAVGFELTTTWSQTRCATGLRYAPTKLAEQQEMRNLQMPPITVKHFV